MTLKHFLTIVIILAGIVSQGQKMTLKEWNKAASHNKGLLPKYGGIAPTEEEKKIDLEFIRASLEVDSTHRKASNRVISNGFNYLYNGDLKTAMLRFNQAYLLDSTNTDIYWGFGGVYMTLGDFNKAKEQYLSGLRINPNNSHILTDYGTYFFMTYYNLSGSKNEQAKVLDSAIVYLTRSYNLAPGAPETNLKLSVCYWNKNDCPNAWKYYDNCKSLGGRFITEEYTKAIESKCGR